MFVPIEKEGFKGNGYSVIFLEVFEMYVLITLQHRLQLLSTLTIFIFRF